MKYHNSETLQAKLAQAKFFENISNHFRLKLVRDTKSKSFCLITPIRSDRWY